MTKRLERMRAGPPSDWTISDVEAVCHEVGLTCQAPRAGGSHYKIAHPSQQAILTIPARRPIKAIYIRKLVAFIEAIEGAP